MSDADRLAAALHKAALRCWQGEKGDKVPHDDIHADDARAIRAADPTLICPDPDAHRLDLDGKPFCPTGYAQRYHAIGECACPPVCPDPADHELADAIERLPGDTDITILRLDADYGPHWYVRFHKWKGTGPTLEAAITAALEDG